MAPHKVIRTKVKTLTDLPNIGKASAGDFRLLGFNTPDEIVCQDPYEMYQRLCAITGQRHDPCVLDVFISVTDFLAGNPPRPWWEFTNSRKQQYPAL